jgi:hypothetical protein
LTGVNGPRPGDDPRTGDAVAPLGSAFSLSSNFRLVPLVGLLGSVLANNMFLRADGEPRFGDDDDGTTAPAMELKSIFFRTPASAM